MNFMIREFELYFWGKGCTQYRPRKTGWSGLRRAEVRWLVPRPRQSTVSEARRRVVRVC